MNAQLFLHWKGRMYWYERWPGGNRHDRQRRLSSILTTLSLAANGEARWTKRKIMPAVTSQRPIRARWPFWTLFEVALCPPLNHRLHQITHDFGNTVSIRVYDRNPRICLAPSRATDFQDFPGKPDRAMRMYVTGIS